MRKMAILFAILALVTAPLFLGCDDDDDDTGMGSFQTGDTTAANFRFMSQEFGEDIFGDFDTEFDLTFALLAEAGYTLQASKSGRRMTNLTATDDTVLNMTITDWQFTNDNWFVFEFEATIREIEFEDGFTDTTLISVSGTDSLQFYYQGSSVDTSEFIQGVDGLSGRAHVQADITEGDDQVSSAIHHRLDMEAGYNSDPNLGLLNAWVNDTMNFAVSDDNGSCLVDVSQTSRITDLVVFLNNEHEDVCPPAGSASMTVDLALACESDNGLESANVEGTWNMTATIDGNMRTIVVTFGNTRWSIEEPNIDCGD